MEYLTAKGKDTRAKIINSAMELWASEGIESVTIRKIADLNKINIASIKYYFGDKENLLKEVFRSQDDYAKEELRNKLEDANSYEDAVDITLEFLLGDSAIRKSFVGQLTLLSTSKKSFYDRPFDSIILEQVDRFYPRRFSESEKYSIARVMQSCFWGSILSNKPLSDSSIKDIKKEIKGVVKLIFGNM